MSADGRPRQEGPGSPGTRDGAKLAKSGGQSTGSAWCSLVQSSVPFTAVGQARRQADLMDTLPDGRWEKVRETTGIRERPRCRCRASAMQHVPKLNITKLGAQYPDRCDRTCKLNIHRFLLTLLVLPHGGCRPLQGASKFFVHSQYNTASEHLYPCVSSLPFILAVPPIMTPRS